MPKREDETWLNVNPSPLKRKGKIYPYPASIECPSCGNFSLYYSDELAKYRCMHESCQAEGKTLKELIAQKARRDEQLKSIFG